MIKVPVTLRCGSSFVKKDIHEKKKKKKKKKKKTNSSTVVRRRRLITSNVSALDAQE
jgi:hypothetical protein